MNEKLAALRLLPLVLAALLPGCGGTETGNPTLPATELRLSALSHDFNSVAIGTPGPGITIDTADVGLSEVRLLGCNGAEPLVFPPLDASLTSKPAVVLRAQGNAAEYCGARVTLSPPAAGALGDRSVYVSGRRADGSAFELGSLLALSVNLVTNPPNTPFPAEKLILGFNFATWLGGVDVNGAAAENGLVTIDPTHNADVLADFDAQAPLAPALYDDSDGNGLLNGDNQPPAAGPP